MNEEEANTIANILAGRLGRIWSVHVSMTRGGKYRVVIHLMNGSEPLAIYNARLLQQPVEVPPPSHVLEGGRV